MSKAEASLTQTWHELNLGVDPNVAKELGYEVPEQYLTPSRDVGSLAVASVRPEIPAEVKAELDAYKAAHHVSEPTDNRHITLAHARGRGAL